MADHRNRESYIKSVICLIKRLFYIFIEENKYLQLQYSFSLFKYHNSLVLSSVNLIKRLIFFADSISVNFCKNLYKLNKKIL